MWTRSVRAQGRGEEEQEAAEGEEDKEEEGFFDPTRSGFKFLDPSR